MPDIVCFRMEFYPPKKQRFFPKYPDASFDKNDNLWLKVINHSHWNICNKAIKKDVIDKTLKLLDTLPPIPRLNMAEDCLKTFLISIFLNNGIYISKVFYHYCCDNLSSITKTTNAAQIKKSYQDYIFILNFIDEIPDLTPITKRNKKALQKSIYREAFALLRRHTYLLLPDIPLLSHFKSLRYDKSLKNIRRTIKIIILGSWAKLRYKISQTYH